MLPCFFPILPAVGTLPVKVIARFPLRTGLLQSDGRETTKLNPKDVTSSSRPSVIKTVQLRFIIRSFFPEDIVGMFEYDAEDEIK
jgi:hypothetical protein